MLEKVVSPKLLAMRVLLYVLGKGVLLIRRRGSNRWELPGGKVSDDSISLEQAAAREFQEETGIPIFVGSFAVYFWDQRSTIKQYEGMRYVCNIVMGFLRFANYYEVTLSEEHDAYCWVEPTPRELEQFKEKHEGDIIEQETLDALSRFYSGNLMVGQQLQDFYSAQGLMRERIAELEEQLSQSLQHSGGLVPALGRE